MLKIETLSVGDQAVVKVIGRLRSENLADLAGQIAMQGAHVRLDMEQVTLVDVEVVRFLIRIQSSETQLTNCPPYIREWMTCERQHTRGT